MIIKATAIARFLSGILTLVIWRIATSIATYRALATTARLNVWRLTSLRNFILNASFFCADIASRWDPVAALPEQPRGILYARLDRLQRELSVSLLRQYVDRAASAVANQAWTDITAAGLDQVCFGWAGPVERGAGPYYALSGQPAHRVQQHPGRGQSHPLRVARPAPRLAGDLLAQHYAGVRH